LIIKEKPKEMVLKCDGSMADFIVVEQEALSYFLRSNIGEKRPFRANGMKMVTFRF